MRAFVCRRAVLTLAILIISHPWACSETLYVSPSGSDTPPYTSWETAATSIQAAIDAASEGDTVLVGPGTFRENVVLRTGLILRGSGSKATIVQADDSAVKCRDVGHVRIESLAITSSSSGQNGGGLLIEDSDAVHVLDCTIKDNEARGGSGGGICATNSGVTIERSVIASNRSEGGGGGVFLGCPGRVCTISHCEFIHNSAVRGCGGGIASYCLGEVTDCIIAANQAQSDGGGVWSGQTMGIWRCIISNNRAGEPGLYGYKANGGGVFYKGGPEEGVVNCVIAGNWASDTGQAVYWEANVNLVNCTVACNQPGERGSAAIEVAYPAELYGTYENVANSILFGSSGTLSGCRARYSAVGTEGEGNIGEDPCFRAHATCWVESIVHSEDLDMTTLVCAEPIGHDDQFRHMFLKLPWTCEPALLIARNVGNELVCYGEIDPKLTRVTLHITDFSLSEQSPCIDAGNNDADYLPETDKAGVFRIYRGRDDWRVDMGAYEYGSRRFEVSSIQPTAEPGHLQITWNSQPLPDKSYSIYFSPDLLAWTLAGSNIPSQGETTSWIDPRVGTSTSRFYRVSSP